MSRLLTPLVRFTLCIAAAIVVLAQGSPIAACMGHPPPPFCAKTISLTLSGPPTLLIPGGGTFDVESLVNFRLFDFPAGTGICPAGPYAVDVTITAICTPAGDGGGSALGVPIPLGYSEITVPVTLPAGPPRVCSLSGVATITLADGMILDNAGTNVACVAEPAPGNPTVPRLDMIILGGPGSEIARVHPGDQAEHVYRITNNDPVEAFLGDLVVDSLNESRTPGHAGPMPPGTGVIAISDPLEGDNFPIGFTQDLSNGCLPLPPDPGNPAIPTIVEPILLPPGEFIDIPVSSRPWGMCADGSCGRSTLVLTGEFSDMTPGLACSGFVTAGDSSVPPTYLWPDAGAVLLLPPPPDPLLPLLPLQGQPFPTFQPLVDLTITQAVLLVNGKSVNPPNTFTGPIDNERGRIQLQFAEPFPVDAFFDALLEITIQPNPGSPPIQTEVIEMTLTGAPTGLEDRAPFTTARTRVEDLVGTQNSTFDIAFQISAVGIDDLGQRRDLLMSFIEFLRKPDGSGFFVQVAGNVEPGPGGILLALEIANDLREFASPEPQGELIFADGFESGDVTSWSASVP